eukprot:TRINITY_DN2911_c1_g3_i1.p1 TRINITY_DN2911_c1_g3~~TRINITY_DN2911_c1_g3_i1.p1  ORF type:complete len:843 (+),score=206.00 TRINITY_DN2911_c1_g3_i1:50-2578(+)
MDYDVALTNKNLVLPRLPTQLKLLIENENCEFQQSVATELVAILQNWNKTLKKWKSDQIISTKEEISSFKCQKIWHYVTFSLGIFVAICSLFAINNFTQGVSAFVYSYVVIPALVLEVGIPIFVYLFMPSSFEPAGHPSTEYKKKICLIIPTMGQTTEERRENHWKILQRTLRAAVRYFGPAVMSHDQYGDNFPNIIVVDNAAGKETRFHMPEPELESKIHAIHPNIQYIWTPVTSKTLAISYAFFNLLDERPIHPKYVFILDDDTIIPYNLPEPEKFLDPGVSGVLIPIRAMDRQTKHNWLGRMQDLEYKKSGIHRIFQGKTGFTLAPHGACSLWRTHALRDVLQRHDSLFQGEDLQMGLIVYEHMPEYTFSYCNAVFMKTEACDTLKHLTNQRGKSWAPTPPRMFFRFLRLIACQWQCNRILVKLYLIQEVYTIIQDCFRVFFVIYGIITDAYTFVKWFLILMMCQFILLIGLNYFKLPKRYRVSTMTIITYPFYGLILLAFRFLGFFYNAFIYESNQRVKKYGFALLNKGALPYVQGIRKVAFLLKHKNVDNCSFNSGWEMLWRCDDDTVLNEVIDEINHMSFEENKHKLDNRLLEYEFGPISFEVDEAIFEKPEDSKVIRDYYGETDVDTDIEDDDPLLSTNKLCFIVQDVDLLNEDDALSEYTNFSLYSPKDAENNEDADEIKVLTARDVRDQMVNQMSEEQMLQNDVENEKKEPSFSINTLDDEKFNNINAVASSEDENEDDNEEDEFGFKLDVLPTYRKVGQILHENHKEFEEEKRKEELINMLNDIKLNKDSDSDTENDESQFEKSDDMNSFFNEDDFLQNTVSSLATDSKKKD